MGDLLSQFKIRLQAFRSDEARLFRHLTIGVMFVGFILRFRQYLANRSLWLDEAFIANAIVSGSWSDFFKPLEYSHRVPPLFLALVKSSICLFGGGDFVLRLIPFCAGVLSLYLFYLVSRRMLSPKATLIAMWFFALSGPLVYFSSEFKQYSTDVAITLLLLLMVLEYAARPARSLAWDGLLLLTGALAVWTSHPSVFVLASAAFFLVYRYASGRETGALLRILCICLFWAASFICLYLLFIRDFGESPVTRWVVAFFRDSDAFMPVPLSTVWFQWMWIKVIAIFQNPGGFHYSIVAFVAFILFMIGVLSTLRHDRKTVFLLITPIFLTLIASMAKKYPVHDRMILFWTPLLILLVSEGIDIIHVKKYSGLFQLALVALLSWHSMEFQTHILVRPKTVEEIKPVLDYVRRHYQKDDVLYLYYWSEPAFRYYAGFYGFDVRKCGFITDPDKNRRLIKEVDHYRIQSGKKKRSHRKCACIYGVSEKFNACHDEVRKLRRRGRVWFIFSHAANDEPRFLKYLDKKGKRLDECIQNNASAYLYMLMEGEKSR